MTYIGKQKINRNNSTPGRFSQAEKLLNRNKNNAKEKQSTIRGSRTTMESNTKYKNTIFNSIYFTT